MTIKRLLYSHISKLKNIYLVNIYMVNIFFLVFASGLRTTELYYMLVYLHAWKETAMLLRTISYKIQYRLNIAMCHDICLCCFFFFTRKWKKIYLVPLCIIKICQEYLS
jgi:hypothetical protein